MANDGAREHVARHPAIPGAGACRSLAYPSAQFIGGRFDSTEAMVSTLNNQLFFLTSHQLPV